MEKKKSPVIHQDVYISLLSIAAGIFLYTVADQMNAQSAFFPKIMLTVFIALMAVILIQGIRKSVAATNAEVRADVRMLKWEQNRMPYAVFLIMVLYVILMKYIGFFIATGIFMPGLMLFFRNRSKKAIIGVTIGSLVLIYLLFVVFLKATLP